MKEKVDQTDQSKEGVFTFILIIGCVTMVALRATTFVVRRQLSTLRDDACCVECRVRVAAEKKPPPLLPHTFPV
jgi:hypothetical protein